MNCRLVCRLCVHDVRFQCIHSRSRRQSMCVCVFVFNVMCMLYIRFAPAKLILFAGLYKGIIAISTIFSVHVLQLVERYCSNFGCLEIGNNSTKTTAATDTNSIVPWSLWPLLLPPKINFVRMES